MCLRSVLQSPEECAAIKAKVKKFIADRNTREGATRSGSGYAGAPPTPAFEIPGEDNVAAPGKTSGQDGVENQDLTFRIVSDSYLWLVVDVKIRIKLLLFRRVGS